MGASYHDTCYGSATDAAGALCATQYPLTYNDGSTVKVQTCAVVDGSHVSITTAAAAAASSPPPSGGGTTTGGSTLYTYYNASDAAVGTEDFGGGADDPCAHLSAKAATAGATFASCVESSDGTRVDYLWNGTAFYATRTSGGTPVGGSSSSTGTTVSLPVSFAVCDPAEQYETLGAIWVSGLVLLVGLVAMRAAFSPLGANQ